MPTYIVQADGLKALRAELKLADASWPTELRKGFNTALQPVVSAIKGALGGGKRASTVKAASSQAAGRIVAGGPNSAAPYTGFFEFGGSVVRHKVFGKPSRAYRITIPKVPSGRVIYPTATRRDDAVVAAMAQVVDDVVKHAGFR